MENNPVPCESDVANATALKNPVGEPYSGTDPKRLWLLRSRPDQVHRRTMRRGPPAEILAELRFARSLESRQAGPEGQYVGPLPGPPPEGEGVGALLRLPLRLASLCLAWLLCMGQFLGAGALLRLPFWLASLCLAPIRHCLARGALLRLPFWLASLCLAPIPHCLARGALLRSPFWLASLCLALYAGLLLTEALLRSPLFTRFAWLPRMPQLLLLGALLRSPLCSPCCALLQQIYPPGTA